MYVVGRVVDYRIKPSAKLAEDVIEVVTIEEADKVADAMITLFETRFRNISHGTCVVLSEYSDPKDAMYNKAIKLYIDCM